jgi:FkbM family methyltransferase
MHALSIYFLHFYLVVGVLSSSIASVHPEACIHHFLDLGSNAGVQIRKLYEPDRFMQSSSSSYKRPRKGGDTLSPSSAASKGSKFQSQLMQAFDEFFGPAGKSRNRAVCAYAFEPNPIHAPRLSEMEAIYASLGWNMKYFPYAVGHRNGSFPLLRENSRFDQAAVLVKNASLFKHSKIGAHNTVQVDVIDLVEFIESRISKSGPRLHIEDTNAGRVIIKMDIEGEEYKLLPNLIASGVLCRHVDAIYVEYHVRHSRKFLEERMVPLTKER